MNDDYSLVNYSIVIKIGVFFLFEYFNQEKHKVSVFGLPKYLCFCLLTDENKEDVRRRTKKKLCELCKPNVAS